MFEQKLKVTIVLFHQKVKIFFFFEDRLKIICYIHSWPLLETTNKLLGTKCSGTKCVLDQMRSSLYILLILLIFCFRTWRMTLTQMIPIWPYYTNMYSLNIFWSSNVLSRNRQLTLLNPWSQKKRVLLVCRK